MKRKVFIIAISVLMILIMGSFVVHADDSAKVKLTIHWSSVDGVDLMPPIVIDNIEPGTRIYNVGFIADMDEKPFFEKAGYVNWTYLLPKPVTEYSNQHPFDTDYIKYDTVLTADTVIYTPMIKEISEVELTLIQPVCGTSTTTPEDPSYTDPSYRWSWDEQTNYPHFTVPSGAAYVPDENEKYIMGYWVVDDKAREPYVGSFTGNKEYFAELYVVPVFGYTFTRNIKPTIKNATIVNTDTSLGQTILVKTTPVHNWDAGKITTAPTMTADGVFTYTCPRCGATKTEKISKLSSPDNFKPGADEKAAEAAILALPNDKDPAGSEFGTLQLKAAKTTKNSIKLAWKKAPGAAKYVIYANACGKGKKYQKLATATGKTKTIKKVAGKKLKKGTYYKFLMVAVDKSGKVVSTSKTVHTATAGGKVGNPAKITTKAKKKVTVKVKKTFKLAAKQTGKKIKKHRAVSYETSNAAVATVSKKGVIKGIKRGTCYVYAYAQNGVAAKIKVTVK